MEYVPRRYYDRGAAAPGVDHLVPLSLVQAEADLLACVQRLALLLIDDWDDTIRYALDNVQEQLDWVRQAIERAPAAILDDHADDYDETGEDR